MVNGKIVLVMIQIWSLLCIAVVSYAWR